MFKKIFLFLAVGIFVLGVNRFSFAMNCGEHSGNMRLAQASMGHNHEAMSESTTQPESKEAVEVGNKICPVSDEKIIEETKAIYEYEGKVYNFCCAMCIKAFEKDPAKYIEKVEEELQKNDK